MLSIFHISYYDWGKENRSLYRGSLYRGSTVVARACASGKQSLPPDLIFNYSLKNKNLELKSLTLRTRKKKKAVKLSN